MSDAETVPRKRAKVESKVDSADEPASTPYALPDHISYARLAEEFPELQQHLLAASSTHSTIDFGDPNSVRTLNRALLHVYFDLDVTLPADSLCPTVANRLHYLEWLQSTVLVDLPPTREITGLDIGCGASCIYPLLGARLLRCAFVGTEINPESLTVARANVTSNSLDSRIHLFLNRDRIAILECMDQDGFPMPVEDTDGSVFAFSMCNPPFYTSQDERDELSRFKIRAPQLDTSGKSDELYTEGGEAAFCCRMVEESGRLSRKVKWFSTMAGKKSTVAILKEQARQAGAKHVREGKLVRGHTTRWLFAWSFFDQLRFCLDALPCPVDACREWFERVAVELRIKTSAVDDELTTYMCEATEKTWTRQWRRQQKAKTAEDQEIRDGNEPVLLKFTAVLGASADGSRVNMYLEPGYPSNLLMSLYNHLIRRTPQQETA